ncbi:MAG TPA: HEAT repeat domain-containing protein [Ktedonobacteraceae bacterium]|nr:HEAT repeat domain-containing protein [Ktedonobacteraceae bacterium]
MEPEEIEGVLEAAAYAETDQRKQLLNEIAIFPDEALSVAFKILRSMNRRLWRVAIEVIHTIGYPQNAEAILWMIARVEDRNFLAREEAIQTLLDMGPTVVVPYLILEMWDAKRHQYWGADVEGICGMLTIVDRAYAVACGPTLVYILGRSDLPPDEDLDKGFLLDVLEKIGPESVTYALPTLIDLVSREGTSEVGKQAQRLILSFGKEALEPYKFLLASIAEEPEQKD